MKPITAIAIGISLVVGMLGGVPLVSMYIQWLVGNFDSDVLLAGTLVTTLAMFAIVTMVANLVDLVRGKLEF